jgi:hypothetical protein
MGNAAQSNSSITAGICATGRSSGTRRGTPRWRPAGVAALAGRARPRERGRTGVLRLVASGLGVSLTTPWLLPVARRDIAVCPLARPAPVRQLRAIVVEPASPGARLLLEIARRVLALEDGACQGRLKSGPLVRQEPSWAECLRAQAASIPECDFLTTALPSPGFMQVPFRSAVGAVVAALLHKEVLDALSQATETPALRLLHADVHGRAWVRAARKRVHPCEVSPSPLLVPSRPETMDGIRRGYVNAHAARTPADEIRGNIGQMLRNPIDTTESHPDAKSFVPWTGLGHGGICREPPIADLTASRGLRARRPRFSGAAFA